MLGGVQIDHPRGLEGHSDADVLTHAVADSLLGAIGLGDIGRHFPDSDAKYKDADSLKLLAEVVGMLIREGWSIANVDSTLIAGEPRIAPHIPAMRARLAEAMGIKPDQISIKATTTEGMGFTGRGEGIAAAAVALVWRTE
jgi:2-C-methyl-D-erythritol 2,4-cyclodiphosphate synthase